LISTVAIGAGGCSKLLNNTSAEFIITGEFSHHEILHEVHRGVSLIVTDHSNTERGFIDQFIQDFTGLLAKENKTIEIFRSKLDRDPLEYI
jgi:putative NIF3 family GTP cyclohydrolase 1 type 2